MSAVNLVLSARAYMKGELSARGEVRAGTMLSGTLAEDIAKQEKWLATEARARGYKDIDQLAEKNYPLFEKLAKLWREKNPAKDGVLLSRDAGALKQQFEAPATKYGGKTAYEAAKSAGKSELTYEQWVQARTPNFMQWWGYDWTKGLENGQDTENLGGRKNDSTRSGDQVGQDAGVVRGRKDAVGVSEIQSVIARGFPFVDAKTGEPLVFFHGTPTERADKIIQTNAATAKPIDAAARMLTRITGVERLTRELGHWNNSIIKSAQNELAIS